MPFTRDQMAARLADDVPEGWCVNLGIGIPTMVANHVPPTREVIFQSENGVIGMGPAPAKGEEDPWLINAGKQLITMAKGASFVGHADSFAMIRGGHIDLCVLGGFEVAENGDLANWATSRERHGAGRRRRHGPGGRGQAALGHHGAHDQGRPPEDRRALRLSADRPRLRQPRLYQPGGAGRDRRAAASWSAASPRA